MKHWGLRSRTILFSMIPTLLACLLLGLFYINQRFSELDNLFEQQGKLVATAYALGLSEKLGRAPITELEGVVHQILEEPHVRAATIYSASGKQLAHAGPEMKPFIGKLDLVWLGKGTSQSRLQYTDETLRVVHPIQTASQKQPDENPHHTGSLEIELRNDAQTIEKYKAVLLTLCVIILTLLINTLVAYRFSKEIAAVIDNIRSALENMLKGDLKTQIQENSYGELRALQHALNELGSSILEGQRELQHNVDQATEDLRETLETIEIQNIELDLARKEALEASRIKSEFLANMSHEIRTPLNGVIGFTHLLMKSELNATQRDYLDTIQKSSESLLAIINDILDFSKIEAGKLVLDQVPINLQETVEDVLTMLAPMAYEKRLEQVSLFYSDVPTHIIGDPLRLKQILTNLVNNAIKFTEQGEVCVRVMLEDITEGIATIKITVTDTGIGLSESQQETLFNAFRQADTTTARRFGGTGLGLVISKHLVEQMRGQIGLESEAGVGSTFWFTFKAEIQNPEQEHMPPLTDTPCTVALYDANPGVRLALKNSFNKRHLQTIECNQLDDVLNLVDQPDHDPAINAIILGITASDPQYRAIVNIIRQNRLSIPLVLLGKHTDQMVLADMLGNEPPPLITKPFNEQKTFNALKALVCHQESDPTKLPSVAGAMEQPKQPANPKWVSKSSIHVIAVDDNPANLKLLTVLLEDLNIQVTPCDSGEKCLELIKNMKFDLILMDVQMPGMDGLETTQKIRAQENEDNSPPIVAVTAHALANEKEKLLKAGMDDYVTKPINETQLIHIIKRWTGVSIAPEANHEDKTQPACEPDDSVDMRLGIQLANGKEDLAEEMLSMLFESLQSDQKKILETFQANEYDNLLEWVHRLHGATRYTGVPRLQRAARSTEEALKKNQLENLEHHVNTLLDEIRRVLEWGKQHRGLELKPSDHH